MPTAAPMKRRRRLPGMPSGDPAAPVEPRTDSAAAGLKDESVAAVLAGSARGSPVGDAAANAVPEAGASGQSTADRKGGLAPEAAGRRVAGGSSGRGKGPRPAPEQGEADVNPYSGAGTTSLTVRVLVPLHGRYRKLVRDLEEEGYKASATELFQALLHFGPADTDEARELLRRWRALLDADPPPRAG